MDIVALLALLAAFGLTSGPRTPDPPVATAAVRPAPAATVPQRSPLRRCSARLRPTGVRELRVRRVACENAARLVANWSAADKRGRVTRVGAFTCVAQGPANAGATGVRCRGRARELVLATLSEPG